MDGPESVFDNETFHKRLGSLAFAAILLTLLTVWMIELKSIFQPFFIALGIYFVLKPGADYLSKNGFPIYLSYLTMLLSAFLVIIAAGYLAFDQVSDLADDEDRIKQYNRQLDNRWNQLKGTPMIGSSITESLNSTNGTFTEDLAEMGLLSDDSGIGDAIGGVVSSVGSLLGMGLTVTFSSSSSFLKPISFLVESNGHGQVEFQVVYKTCRFRSKRASIPTLLSKQV